jgi:hypothetical protein
MFRTCAHTCPSQVNVVGVGVFIVVVVDDAQTRPARAAMMHR